MAVFSTLQPVFNKIWQEFVVGDRKRAVKNKGIDEICVYRGGRNAHSNTRCAIGVCIPDDMYDPRIESNSVIAQVQRNMPEWYESVFNGIDVTALSFLQATHDMYFDEFESRMREFADTNHLLIPE